jgi:hypothetical protein
MDKINANFDFLWKFHRHLTVEWNVDRRNRNEIVDSEIGTIGNGMKCRKTERVKQRRSKP